MGLKIRRPRAEQINCMCSMEQVNGSRPRVLVVEDSYASRCEIRAVLGTAYELVEAGNGAEALSIAREAPFDLVIADVNMPVMGGIEFVRMLKGLPEYDGVPVLIVTAESSDADVSRARAAGVAAWLVKPLSPQGLLSAVARLLGHQVRNAV